MISHYCNKLYLNLPITYFVPDGYNSIRQAESHVNTIVGPGTAADTAGALQENKRIISFTG